jgi:hypothetical protein
MTDLGFLEPELVNFFCKPVLGQDRSESVVFLTKKQ